MSSKRRRWKAKARRRQPFKVHRWSDPLYDVSVFLLHGKGTEALDWLDATFGGVRGNEVPTGAAFTGAKTLWIERPKGVAPGAVVS